MSDEAANPVVQEAIKEEVSPLAEDTTPKQESQVEETKETNPLEPGGERFKQVWARAKQAEAKAAELEAERQREREERIRLEERLKAQEQQKTEQPEMSWEQLENGIAEGKWTRDQAWKYKEDQLAKRLERENRAKQEQETTVSKVLGEIESYKSLIPNLTVMARMSARSSQEVVGEALFRIEMSRPGAGSCGVLSRIEACQIALSGSGIRRRDHILDPRTGRPVRGRLAVWVSLPCRKSHSARWCRGGGVSRFAGGRGGGSFNRVHDSPSGRDRGVLPREPGARGLAGAATGRPQ